MAEKALITRRAAIVGAVASSAALALPAVAAVQATQQLDIDGQLAVLSRQFIAAAKAIDPTIKNGWIGNDASLEYRGSVYGVFFDRRDIKKRPT